MGGSEKEDLVSAFTVKDKAPPSRAWGGHRFFPVLCLALYSSYLRLSSKVQHKESIV